MNARLLAATLAVVFVSTACSAPAPKSGEDETPYKSAKVGDFATYKVTTKFAGTNVDGVMTQTVTAKSEKEMTIKTSTKMTVMGMDIPSPDQENKIDLTKPFDPIKGTMLTQGMATPPVVEKLKDGKEKVKVGGKDYEAGWTTYTVKMNAGAGQPIDANLKVWTSAKVPTNMLKMEITANFMGMNMEMSMELTETGSKDK